MVDEKIVAAARCTGRAAAGGNGVWIVSTYEVACSAPTRRPPLLSVAGHLAGGYGEADPHVIGSRRGSGQRSAVPDEGCRGSGGRHSRSWISR